MASPWRLCSLLVLLTVLAYLPGLSAGFVWDDHWLITTNQSFQTGDLRQLITEALFAQARMDTAFQYFRPVQALSFWIDRTIFGADAALWHLHSLLIHLINVSLLFALLLRVLPASEEDPLRLRALVGTAFFALHPLQSEAVVWISARNELLYSAFVLAGLNLLVGSRSRPEAQGGKYRLAGGLLCFALALFSKETAILFPLLVFLLDDMERATPDRKRLARYGLLVLLLVLAVAWRAWSGVLLETEGELTGPRALARIPWLHFVGALPRLFGAWGVLVGLPYPLMVTRSIYSGLDSLLVPSWLGLGMVPVSVWWVLRQPSQPLRRLGMAGLGCALCLLLPPLLAVAETGLVGERYLYLPLAFIGLALSALMPSVRALRVLSAVGGVLGLLLLQLRLPEWRSDVTLFAADQARSPSCLSATQLGGAYVDAGYPQEALKVLVPDWTGNPACSAARTVARQAHEALDRQVP